MGLAWLAQRSLGTSIALGSAVAFGAVLICWELCAAPDRERALADVAAAVPGSNPDARAIAGHVSVSGNLDDVTERLCEYADAGTRHFIFVASRDELTTLATEVVPRMREHHRSSPGPHA